MGLFGNHNNSLGALSESTNPSGRIDRLPAHRADVVEREPFASTPLARERVLQHAIDERLDVCGALADQL